MYKGLEDEKKKFVRLAAGAIAIYIGYRQFVEERWPFLGIAVLLFLSCFHYKENYVSEEGVEIRHRFLFFKKRDIWQWDEVKAVQLNRVSDTGDIGMHFAKGNASRSFAFKRADAEEILELIKKENPDITISNHAF